jgi:hypothetical protein
MPGSRQQQQQEGSPVSVDLGRRFLRRLWHLLTVINAAPALSLVLVSLAETLIVSRIGTISGLFYQGQNEVLVGFLSAGLGLRGKTQEAVISACMLAAGQGLLL